MVRVQTTINPVNFNGPIVGRQVIVVLLNVVVVVVNRLSLIDVYLLRVYHVSFGARKRVWWWRRTKTA